MEFTVETSLFSEELIPQKTKEALPQGFVCRPLQRSDFRRGHLDVLTDLAPVGEITEDMWIGRFDWMKQCNGTYFVVVIADEKNDVIVWTGTLMMEGKL